MTGIRRALAITTAERYFALGSNFITLAVISRILTPNEIGVSVLGLAIVGMALAAREFATTNFLIQRQVLKIGDVRATFTILLLVSLLISGGLNLLAVPLARAYSHPGIEPFLRILSLSIVIESVSGLISGLLRREMAFGKAAVLNITNSAVTATVTIALAMLSFSYMSFAYGNLAAACAMSGLSLAMWRDRSIFRPCLRGWRGMAAFGGYNGVNVILFRIYDSIPYIVFGSLMSIDTLAVYNRAVLVCQLPGKVILGGVNSVLISAFSAEIRDGKDLREHYLHSIRLITCMHWPALILLAILAEPVVNLVLGPQWVAAVPIVRILALALLASFSVELDQPILVAFGAMRDLLTRSLIVWPISAIVIASAAVFGIRAAAMAWLVTIPFQAYVSVVLVQRHVAVRWSEIAYAMGKSFVVTVFAIVGPLVVVAAASASGNALTLVLTAAAVSLSAVGWIFGLWFVAHPLFDELKYAAAAIARTVGVDEVSAFKISK